MKKGILALALGLILILFNTLLVECQAEPTSKSRPKFMGMASYETGAATYPWGVGIASAIEKKMGIKVRIIPTKTDVSKAVLLRSKEATLTLLAATAYFMFNGKEEYDSSEWGPQPLRIQWIGGNVPVGMMTRADSGIKKISDLRGKKVAFMPGVYGPNLYNEGYLAFGGLTWNDVKKLNVPSYGASHKAVQDGAADATSSALTAPGARELEAGHGIYWLPVPFEDKEGWARLMKTTPVFFPEIATEGAGGISKNKPLEVANFSSLILTYDWLEEDLGFEITKSIAEGYDIYKSVAPALANWTFDTFLKCLPMSYIPLHPGCIKYLKKVGRWKNDFDEHQTRLLSGEAQRVKAWKDKYGLK